MQCDAALKFELNVAKRFADKRGSPKAI